MRRRNNQDSYNIVLADSLQAWEKIGHLFIVADGMGAHAAGELASRLAADLIPHHYQKNQKLLPAEALARSITDTNAEIYRRGQANPEFRNMGTTASVLALLPEGAVAAHVGDSRIYRLRGQQFEQLTFDHSLVWEMQASGEVNEETIRSGVIPKNVITRSLGPNPLVQVDIEGPFPLRKGDRFLLCSDGLSGQISDEEMGVLLQSLDPNMAAQVMVDLANLRGGPDNITVLIIEIADEQIITTPAVSSTSEPRREVESGKFSTALAIVTVICFLAAAILLFMGHWPMAIVVAVLGSIAIGTGFAQRRPKETLVDFDSPQYGRGPHRRYACKPDQQLTDQLRSTIEALRDASKENDWKLDWGSVQPMLDRGQQASRSRDYKQAIQELSAALIAITQLMRNYRSEAKDSDSIF